MLEIASADICYTPEEYFALSNQIQNSHIQFGLICLVIGFVLGRYMPYLKEYIKRWKDGRTSE